MGKMKKTIAVIGEGITEYYYMESVKDAISLKPKPFCPTNSSLKELENEIKKCIDKGYSKVFCLIDMDNKINDGTDDHIAKRKQYLKLKSKYHDKTKSGVCVRMLESYPCTELFFLFYFRYTTAPQTNEGLKKSLEERFGYDVSEKYFIKHSLHNAMSCFGGDLKQAIANAKKSVNNRDASNIHCVYTEIGELFDELGVK